jgi:cold shock CspA family protein
MRLSRTLRSWKDDRGFGFIAPTHGGAELFVHISALPRDGSRPTVGERLTYELGRGKNGQPLAVNVQRDAIGQPAERARVWRSESGRSHSLLKRIVGLALLVALGAFGFSHYQKRALVSALQAQPLNSTPEQAAMPAPSAQAFKCDGRTHCSQMTSCAEAKFFLKNCPGTQTDGNHDGTPCEQQWCTSPFAK